MVIIRVGACHSPFVASDSAVEIAKPLASFHLVEQIQSSA